MIRKIFRVFSLIIALCSLCFAFSCGEPLHEHVFYKKTVSEEYLASTATCTEPTKYYFSCDCGEHGEETFDEGESLGHYYQNYVCETCGAEEYSEGIEWKHEVYTNTYTVMRIGDCTDEEVIIPSTYNGLPVTKIRDRAFYHTKIKRVVIGNNVKNIGTYAFHDCKNLESVVIGSSVSEIGEFAFRECTSLTQIVIPESVNTLGAKAFFGCGDALKIYCKAQAKPSGWSSDWNLFKKLQTGSNSYTTYFYNPTWNYA